MEHAERPQRPQLTPWTTLSQQAPPAPMANGSPKTAPPLRRSEPIMPPEMPRPSRSLTDWIMLVGLFIFLVILSHGQMSAANELKKLNQRMGAQLAFSPPTAPPPPYPVGVPPPSPLNLTTPQPNYEYLVDTFQLPCCLSPHPGYNNVNGLPRDGCFVGNQLNPTCPWPISSRLGNDGYRVGQTGGNGEFTIFLNNKTNEGWNLLQIIDGAAVKLYFDTSTQITCIFYRHL